MSTAALIEQMAAAGAPMEAIIIAVRAVEEAGAAAERIREQNRERKRNQRARAADGADGANADEAQSVTVTAMSRDGHATVTTAPPSLPSPQTPQPTHPREEKPRTRKATQLPASWKPEPLQTGKSGEIAKRRGAAWLAVEEEKFGHYFRGEGKAKLDWQSTWANWVINAETRDPPGRSQPPPGSSSGSLYAAARKFDRAAAA